MSIRVIQVDKLLRTQTTDLVSTDTVPEIVNVFFTWPAWLTRLTVFLWWLYKSELGLYSNQQQQKIVAYLAKAYNENS